jgi:hypothetical protein
MDAVWLALEQSPFAAHVRNAVLIYPIANVAHVVAVVFFFGAVAAMDLRLLNVIGGTPAREVVARLRPPAVAALIVILVAGFVLFSAEASALARNPVFQIKIGAIAVALANVAVNVWSVRSHGDSAALVRFTAGFSLSAWLGIAALGRSIAYV